MQLILNHIFIIYRNNYCKSTSGFKNIPLLNQFNQNHNIEQKFKPFYLDYFTAFLLLKNSCIVSMTIGESGLYDNKETPY